jgi:quinol monooxygenase YgiN
MIHAVTARRWRTSFLLPVALVALALTGCSGAGGAADTADTTQDDAAYATVRRYEGVIDPAEAGKRVAEGFVPLISAIPGFMNYYWIDAGDGVMVSTSVFRDKAGAEQSNSTAASWVAENLAPLLPNPPQITVGDVVAREERPVADTMYATVRRYEGVTDAAEAGRRVREGFLPIIREIPGFIAYDWVDAGGGVMVSTSVFRDQAGAEQSNAAAADWVAENLAPLLPNPPQITAGNVVAHH